MKRPLRNYFKKQMEKKNTVKKRTQSDLDEQLLQLNNRKTVRKGDDLDFDFDLLSKVYELEAQQRQTEDLNLKNATTRKKQKKKLHKEEMKITKNGRLNVTKIEKHQSEELPKKKFTDDDKVEKKKRGIFKMKKKIKKEFSKIVELSSSEEEDEKHEINKQANKMIRQSFKIRKSFKQSRMAQKINYQASSDSVSDNYNIKFDQILEQVDPNTLYMNNLVTQLESSDDDKLNNNMSVDGSERFPNMFDESIQKYLYDKRESRDNTIKSTNLESRRSHSVNPFIK